MQTKHKVFGVIAALAVVASLTFGPGPVKHVGLPSMYPDSVKTPGSLNINVTQSNIHQTICVAGWTASGIRPAASYTTSLKNAQLKNGYALNGDMDPADYEEDHFISLELGGNPTDARNLWPEPYNSTSTPDYTLGAHQKDQIENFLHKEVCNGTITLAQAQTAITKDWFAIYVAGSGIDQSAFDNDDEQ